MACNYRFPTRTMLYKNSECSDHFSVVFPKIVRIGELVGGVRSLSIILFWGGGIVLT